MTTKYKFGLIGQNISYSRSQAIFEAVFKIMNVSGSLKNYSIAPENFESEFGRIITSGVQGLSVTIPYKSRVISFLDDIAPVARALDAVNSISITPSGLTGHNTDCYGFSLPLRADAQRLKHGRALVLGCGGAAKAVVYSLYTDYEIKDFIVACRSMEKLTKFKDSLSTQIPGIKIRLETLDNIDHGSGGSFDIAVNCTPAGGWNLPEQSPVSDLFDWTEIKLYYDLNYNEENKIIGKARSAGIRALDGSAMLVGQALRSFKLWTGEDVSFEEVYEVVFGR